MSEIVENDFIVNSSLVKKTFATTGEFPRVNLLMLQLVKF
jgi:hypothetical protein